MKRLKKAILVLSIVVVSIGVLSAFGVINYKAATDLLKSKEFWLGAWFMLGGVAIGKAISGKGGRSEQA